MKPILTIDLDQAGHDRPARAANNPYMAPKTADVALSMAVMRLNKPAPQACWKNAFLAYNDAAMEAASEVYYVEGQMLIPLKSGAAFAIEHAWLETEDGRVIETTIHDAAQGDAGWSYYTGLRLTMEEVLEWLAMNRNLLPLLPLIPRLSDFKRLNQAVTTAMAGAYFEAWGIDLHDVIGLRPNWSQD